ncbi:MAG: phosphomannomutase [Nevskiales bacterium]
MGKHYSCFLAYDLRGRVPDELNPDFVYRIARAYADFLKPRTVAVGYDVRLSSPALADALSRGLNDAGVDVLDIGLGGTEELYYATFAQKADGGVMITASHNPMDYNGFKFVREEARPISADTGLLDIEQRVFSGQFSSADRRGTRREIKLRPDYARYLLNLIKLPALKPLRIVTNAGHGGAGLVVDALAPELPFEFIKLQHEPDGRFPQGVPNPILPENRAVTAAAVRQHRADFGVAWDGDFDRCFFFDERGEFIEGYYLVGLIAQTLLEKHPGEKVVIDPRLTWNTLELVQQYGGHTVTSKAGHAFIKETMRRENAIYGGEMSAHHYFRDFAYCDNGHLPWLLIAQLISETGKSLSQLVGERIARYPASGEINRQVADADAAQARIEKHYAQRALKVERIDGLGMEFSDWRFNLRKSNTEPLVRLNVEARGDAALTRARTQELLQLLGGESAAGAH